MICKKRDYRGDKFTDWSMDLKGNNDLLSITQPKIVEDIHNLFLEAGANIIETNTFNSNAPSMADYGMQDFVYELNFSAAQIARKAVDDYKARTKGRFLLLVYWGQPIEHAH